MIKSQLTFVRRLLAGAFATATMVATSVAFAAYPDKPIRMVVGFSAGGTTDVVARIVGKEMSETLGQPVVIENRPGAGSNIAAEMVARAEPDGYTLLMVAVTSAINQTLYKNLKFNLVTDFTPIALAARVPNVLVLHPSVQANSVKELVDLLKKNPGTVNFASSGSGTSIHMAGELFKLRTGVDVAHIPYKGSANALSDLIGGQVQYMFDNMPSAWPHVESGKLRALAVTTKDRSATAPNLPTMQEEGFDGFDVSSWFGVIGPKGMSSEVVDKLNKAIREALAKPEVRERFAALGAVPADTTPAQFGEFIKTEVESWEPVVKASGARVD